MLFWTIKYTSSHPATSFTKRVNINRLKAAVGATKRGLKGTQAFHLLINVGGQKNWLLVWLKVTRCTGDTNAAVCIVHWRKLSTVSRYVSIMNNLFTLYHHVYINMTSTIIVKYLFHTGHRMPYLPTWHTDAHYCHSQWERENISSAFENNQTWAWPNLMLCATILPRPDLRPDAVSGHVRLRSGTRTLCGMCCDNWIKGWSSNHVIHRPQPVFKYG